MLTKDNAEFAVKELEEAIKFANNGGNNEDMAYVERLKSEMVKMLSGED